MTDFEFSRAICKVDPAELLAWIRAHQPGETLAVNALPVSTKRDNYGLGGKKAKNKTRNVAKRKAFQAGGVG